MALCEVFMNRKVRFRELLILQAVVIVYTFAGIIGKFAAGQEPVKFLLLYAVEIGVLGVYAILWQQMIRRFELSVAYANRSVALAWSLLWAVLIFGEELTVKKVAGVLFVIAGTAIINGGGENVNES